MLLENKIKLNRVCPICSSNYAYKIYELKASKDEKEKVLSKSNIVLCDNCNFIFDDSSYTQKDYDEHYQFGETFATNSAGSGGSRDTDIQRYDFQIDKIVKHLKDKNANILDIGCAKGGLLKRFIDRGYKNIYAIEPEKSCVDILRKDNIDAKLGSIFDINKFDIKFDVVIMSHVLEHIWDLEKIVNILKSIIAENGIIYIEVPDIYNYYQYFYKPFYHFCFEHINHFSTNSLQMLFYKFDCLDYGSHYYLMPNMEKYPIAYCVFRNTDENKKLIISKDEKGVNLIGEYIKKSFNTEKDTISKLSNINNNYPSFLWGFGYYGRRLLMEKEIFKDINLVGVIDRNPTFTNFEVKIYNGTTIPMNIVKDDNLDFINKYEKVNIFISSPIFENEIKDYILSKKIDCNIYFL